MSTARTFQHALDDAVGALPMLDDLFQIAFEKRHQVPRPPRGRCHRAVRRQAPPATRRSARKSIHDIQRVLDLVRDVVGELAEKRALQQNWPHLLTAHVL
jgi:hypothetical protein